MLFIITNEIIILTGQLIHKMPYKKYALSELLQYYSLMQKNSRLKTTVHVLMQANN